MSSDWQCLLELDSDRRVVSGNRAALRAALARGADFRMYTEWLFEEHIAPDLGRAARGDEAGVVQEVIDFRQVILVGDDDAAGVTTQRQAITPTIGFNPNGPPRMSFFMYDLDGRQACANLMLDASAYTEPGRCDVPPPRADMPKMHDLVRQDIGTRGPSVNFIYDMERYRYFVRDDWRMMLHHDEQGHVLEGSLDALHAMHQKGCELKVAVRDLAVGDPHEVISLTGTSWVHAGRRELETLTHPLVCIRASRPLQYASGSWDVAWVFLSTSGAATVRRLDAHSRTLRDQPNRFAVRWFVR
jgi:hypothetical protein